MAVVRRFSLNDMNGVLVCTVLMSLGVACSVSKQKNGEPDASSSDTDTDTDTGWNTDTGTEWPDPNDDPVPMCWVTTITGSVDNYAKLYAATPFPDGSTVLVGLIESPAVFGPGETAETELVPAGEADWFMARYRSDGELEWARRVGGAGQDIAEAVNSLADGGFVVTGSFDGSVTFGQGEDNETTLVSDEIYGGFLARYQQDGNLVWALRVGAAGQALTVQPDGSIVVAGGFYWQTVFGEGEESETTLDSSEYGSAGRFVARYTADGSLAWVVPIQRGGHDFGPEIALDQDGAFLVTGEFSNSVVFAPDEPEETECFQDAVFTDLDFGLFAAKYQPDGNLAWARCAVAAAVKPGSAEVLADGTFVVIGAFYRGIAFSFEGSDVVLEGPYEGNTSGAVYYVARYSTDGNLLWAETAYNPNMDNKSSARHAGTLPAGDTFLMVGNLTGNSIIGPGDPNETLLNAPGGDMFLAEFDAEGYVQWAAYTGGGGGGVAVLAVHGDGTAVVGGRYGGAPEFQLEGGGSVTLEEPVYQFGTFVLRACP